MPAIVKTMCSLRARLLAAQLVVAVAFVLGHGPAWAASREPAPLFTSNDVLHLTLAMPVRTIVARKKQRPKLAGKLSYMGKDGKPVELDVKVTTRGHSRLEICSFPPLKLNFKRKQVAGTLFAGQNKLKLSTDCMSSRRYQDYLQLEYVIYRIYEQLTPLSFRVRSVEMTYIDTASRRNRSETGHGFLVEDIKGVAARAGMRVAKQKTVARSALDPEQLALLSVFEYMIGNTDWSAISPEAGSDCCHNAAVLVPRNGSGKGVDVPYDFDQAGMIDTEYALPDKRLPIRSVRDRLYRGLCSGNSYLQAIVSRFDAARPKIEALFQTVSVMDSSRREAMRYLADSYAIIDDAAQRQKQIVAHCR